MKKRRWYFVFMGLATFHLIVICLGAASIDLNQYGRLGEGLAYYAELSGASAGYGFFAPGVGHQLRARFNVLDKTGKVTPVELATPSSHEASVRIGNIIDQFGGEDDEERSQQVNRSLAASLAAKIFSNHPEAREVEVNLEVFEPVSMAEYRGGRRPEWASLYSTKFAYDAAPKKSGKVRVAR